MKRAKIITPTLAVLFLALGGIFFYANQPVQAVSAGDWNASNIIDDAVFYDNNSMSIADIQAFLNSKNPSCDTNGTKPASEYGRPDLTHAQYAASVGWPGPPYVCLRDYYQVPRSDQNINNLSTNVRPDGSVSAAEIIKRASDAYGINPKVLLVLIQKESVGPLLTDTWPLPAQYRSVVGYACPDTAPCDPKYAGFYNQIMNAAYQFKYYKDHAYDTNRYGVYVYRHQPYNTVDLLFNPNASCGSTKTRMDNYATTGLYNYTPYQPNQAALNNMYGTGDDCSAYGNRNFWRLFIDWFGSVRGYTLLDTQRWMVVPSAAYKKDPTTGNNVDQQIPAGTHLYFVDKTFVNGQWYLRTEYDKNHNINKGIPQSALGEVSFQTFSEPRYLELTDPIHKSNPITRWVDTSRSFTAHSRILFKSKVLINNIWFYRTAYDHDSGKILAIPADKVKEVSFDTFETPRYMRIKNTTEKIDPIRISNTTTQQDTQVPGDTVIHFDSKVFVGGNWFYRASSDTTGGSPLAIVSADIEELPYQAYVPSPTWLQLKNSTTKVHPASGATLQESSVPAGTHLKISGKITVNGITYFRTEFDNANSLNKGIPESEFEPIPYVSMEQPRDMTLSRATRKVNPSTGIESGDTFAQDLKISFTTKITVNGRVFLRSQHDTSAGNNLAIPFELLKNTNR